VALYIHFTVLAADDFHITWSLLHFKLTNFPCGNKNFLVETVSGDGYRVLRSPAIHNLHWNVFFQSSFNYYLCEPCFSMYRFKK
jgi:hypothetical protein